MRTFVKAIKTWLSRRTWFYKPLFFFRACFYASCEWISLAISRIRGRQTLIGIDAFSKPEPSSPFKYEIAAALRFKNEAAYLAEWIEFHAAVGIDHVYLYNNRSADNFQEVLAPYIASNRVTLHDWPDVPASPAADLHCITQYKDEAKWIAFIDADEFLLPVGEAGIKPILRRFENVPALAINWIYFGSNGHVERPKGGVLENYTRRSAVANRHVKAIVNPRRVIKYGNSHHWFYSRASLATNTRGKRVFGSFSEPAVADVLRINHYYSKSREEFMAKAAMKSWVDREGARFPSRTADAWDRLASINNDVEDRTACRFAVSSKPELESIS
jgi:hypothetical protein